MPKLLSRTTLGGALGLVAILLFAPILQAQVVTSEIRGTVIDQDGQPVAGAQVSVTDTRTNVTRGALTNENGRYYPRISTQENT